MFKFVKYWPTSLQTMMSSLIFYAILFVFVLSVQGAKCRVKEGTKEWRNVTSTSSTLRLRCRSGQVMYHVIPNSYKSTNGKRCSGLQPNMLVESYACHWKKHCKIQISSRVPIVFAQNDQTCLGQKPDLMSLQFFCLKKKKIFYIVSKKRNKPRRKKDYGMIVSHYNYPWKYPPGIKATLELKPRSSIKTVLVLQVLAADIFRMGDNSVEWDTAEVNGLGLYTHNVTRIRASSATFRLYTAQNSLGGSGFVVCFCWLKETEHSKIDDVCQHVRLLSKRIRKTKTGKL